MNAYVAGGWAATAVMLALYAARMLYRGRTLTRSLPAEPVPITGAASSARAGSSEPEQASSEVDPSSAPGARSAPASEAQSASEEVRAWP